MSGLTPHMKPRRAPARRGVATLVVVMVLFFILALTAAYTNRNLIFEQKTSSNQYRSTQAFEAAEAGLEWALAQLNGGLVNSSCQPDNTNGRSFRDRYLGMFGSSPTILADGTIVPRTRSNGAADKITFFGDDIEGGGSGQVDDDGGAAVEFKTRDGIHNAVGADFFGIIHAHADAGLNAGTDNQRFDFKIIIE